VQDRSKRARESSGRSRRVIPALAASQAAEKLARVKGTGFSPYIILQNELGFSP